MAPGGLISLLQAVGNYLIRIGNGDPLRHNFKDNLFWETTHNILVVTLFICYF